MFIRTPQNYIEEQPSTFSRCSFLKFLNDHFINSLSHFVWPEKCPVCGKIGLSCCESCMRSVVFPLAPFCAKCGGPYGLQCCSDPIPCNAASLHDGISRELLINLKYKNVRSLGIPMGRFMGETFKVPDTDVLIPVPLHKSSKREYNQSALLAEGTSLIWKIPVDAKVLKWKKDLMPQVGRTSPARYMMPTDAMKVSCSLEGTSVVIVDDVYTTGNTLRAAMSAVEAAGGKVSSLLVWSRRIASAENEAAWAGV